MKKRKRLLALSTAFTLLASLAPVSGPLPTADAATFSASVDINTTDVTTIPYAIRGINNEFQKGVAEFTDQTIIDWTKNLDMGWIRWPGGTNVNFFNWKTGLTDHDYMAQVYSKTKQYFPYMDWMKAQRATQVPERLSDFNNFLQQIGAKTSIPINYQDSVEKVEDLAKFVKDNNIPVMYWELTNEPYYYQTLPSLYKNTEDYLAKMKPYNDVIKSVLPNAKILISYFGDNPAWNDVIFNYNNPYWDGANYHRYDGTGSSVANAIKDANEAIATTSSYINNNIIAKMQDPNAPIFVGEIGPGTDGKLGESVYHGILNAETILRAVKNDNIKAMGGFRLYNGYLSPDNDHVIESIDNYQRGIKADATQFDFGFYYEAPAVYTGVMDRALNNSSTLWGTTVTGGTTVDRASTTMPALYAQAFRGSYGNKNYLVIVNKSDSTHNVTVKLNGTNYGGTFTKVYANAPNDGSGNPDPVARNRTNHTLVQEATATGVANPVAIAPYSVTRLEWTPASAQADLAPQAPWVSHADATAAGTVTVKWHAADGANSYNIKYGTSPGSLGSSITGISNTLTSTNVTGLSANTTYYFKVEAVGSTATTASENTASATTAVPGAPLMRSAYVERDSNVIVEWQSVPGAIGYKVRYKLDGGTYGTPIDVGNTAGTTITGLTNGAKYWFQVAAYNGYGTGAYSTEDAGFPNDDLPFSPNDISVTGALNASSATINWNPSYGERYLGYFETGDGTASGWTVNDGVAYTVVNHPNSARATKVFKSSGSGDQITTRGSATDANYDVEANINVTSYATGGRVGVIGRFTNLNNYYYFTYANGTGTFRLAKYVGGATTLLGSVALADAGNVNINDMTLRLVMRGNSLTAMVNDTELMTVTDSSHSAGKFGLYASGQAAHFDQVIQRISETATYRLYRSTSPDTGFTQIAGGLTGTSYTDNTLTPGVVYYYKMKGLDANGAVSVGFSNIYPRR